MATSMLLFSSTLCFGEALVGVGTVTGFLGNILKVKSVHLDSSGDRGADSKPIVMLWLS